jgi:hypothetical protein
MLTRSFETLLDLPKGLLVPEQDRTNRSLTYGETEIIRQINEEQAKRDWSDGDYRHFIRRGVTIELKKRTPEPGELAIETPRWAAERAATAAAEAAAQIAKLGVPVMGDLNQLTRLPSAINESTDDPPAPLIPAAAAVAGIVGAVNAGIVGQSAPRKAAGISSDELARPLGNVTTKDLANILADRVKNRAGRAVKAGPKK